jgi:hypothetical protein
VSTFGPDDDALQELARGAATAPPADLARVLDGLRSAPTAPVDHTAKRAVVEQMATVLTSPARPLWHRRRVISRFSRRSAALAFAGTLLFGGAAVAATGGGVLSPVFGSPSRPSLQDDVTTTSSDSAGSSTTAPSGDTTTTGDSGDTTTSAPGDTTTTADVPTPVTTPTTYTCDNAPNHGAWVSQAAHDHSSPNHGQSVRDAAHSDCGKAGGPDGSGDSNGSGDDHGDGSSTTTPSNTTKPAHGDGNGDAGNHGNGHGNDQGNNNDQGNSGPGTSDGQPAGGD